MRFHMSHGRPRLRAERMRQAALRPAVGIRKPNSQRGETIRHSCHRLQSQNEMLTASCSLGIVAAVGCSSSVEFGIEGLATEIRNDYCRKNTERAAHQSPGIPGVGKEDRLARLHPTSCGSGFAGRRGTREGSRPVSVRGLSPHVQITVATNGSKENSRSYP